MGVEMICSRGHSAAFMPSIAARAGLDARDELSAEFRRIGPVAVVLTVFRSLPVYPDQRTFAGYVGMSQRCQ